MKVTQTHHKLSALSHMQILILMLIYIMYISGCESGCRLLNYIKDRERAESGTGGKREHHKNTHVKCKQKGRH